ncbi:MAG: type III polyketide synthase [Deltaproteobacteria bacterium]
MRITITDIAVCDPPFSCTQRELLAHVLREPGLSKREQYLYRTFLTDPGIGNRNFAVKGLDGLLSDDLREQKKRFEETAPALAAGALSGVLSRSRILPGELDWLSTATCTGYLCPGLSSYIIGNAGLRTDICAEDITGMGCGAALPCLRSASLFLNSRGSWAAAVCAEICSADMVREDDPEIILSNCLFGDGAAACLLTNRKDARGSELIDIASLTFPEYREKLRFRDDNGRLRNVIKTDVPGLAAEFVAAAVDGMLKRHSIDRSQVDRWAFHPGGRKILDSIKQVMGLREKDMRFSRAVLKRYGNMSSPSILYVLKSVLEEKSRKPSTVVAASFGAGFGVHACLLRKDPDA